MARTYLVTGIALKDGTIRLDAGTDLPPGRVRAIVEPDRRGARGSIFEIAAPPPQRTAQQVLDDLQALRDEWNERT